MNFAQRLHDVALMANDEEFDLVLKELKEINKNMLSLLGENLTDLKYQKYIEKNKVFAPRLKESPQWAGFKAKWEKAGVVVQIEQSPKGASHILISAKVVEKTPTTSAVIAAAEKLLHEEVTAFIEKINPTEILETVRTNAYYYGRRTITKVTSRPNFPPVVSAKRQIARLNSIIMELMDMGLPIACMANRRGFMLIETQDHEAGSKIDLAIKEAIAKRQEEIATFNKKVKSSYKAGLTAKAKAGKPIMVKYNLPECLRYGHNSNVDLSCIKADGLQTKTTRVELKIWAPGR